MKENTGRVGEKIKVGRKLVIYALSYQTEANWEDIRKKKMGKTHTHTIFIPIGGKELGYLYTTSCYH